MENEEYEKILQKFSLEGLNSITYPQNVEWEERILERTHNLTRCAVIRDDADGPHVPWLFVPGKFNDQALKFADIFKKVFGYEYLGGSGVDGRNLRTFDLPSDCTDEQAQALIEELEK
jgi:hypothetical protein